MDLVSLRNEAEWRKCFPSGEWDELDTEVLLAAFVYFCCNYWHIRHPARGRILFELRDAQIDTVRGWLDHRYTIVLKARQIGFSTLAAAFAFWLCYGWGDRYIAMLSKAEREAISLLKKSTYGFKFLPEWMKLRGPVVGSNLTEMSFSNESTIRSLPSQNEPARGESVFLVIIDEWAFLKNPDEAWASVEPIADVGGRVIGLSTANGEGNSFHEMWVKAKGPWGNGTGRFFGIFHPWSAGDRDQAWYDAKKADLPDWQLAQEYPSNPDEAFLRSGRPVFNTEKLRSLETREPRKGYVRSTPHGFEFVEDGGNLSLYEEPREGGVYVIGADVAEGLEHGDYSSAHIIDARNDVLVGHWHGHIDADLFGTDVLAVLGWWFNTALVGVESNNHGLVTLKALQRANYPNMYRQRRLANRQAQETDLLGWRTTATTKPVAIDELSMAIRDDRLAIPDQPTIAELRTFRREGNGKMHGSPHDDRVMSLAIANQMRTWVWTDEYRPKDGPVVGSLDWYLAMLENHQGDETMPIGAFNVA